jgi:hypothetical protein
MHIGRGKGKYKLVNMSVVTAAVKLAAFYFNRRIWWL